MSGLELPVLLIKIYIIRPEKRIEISAWLASQSLYHSRSNGRRNDNEEKLEVGYCGHNYLYIGPNLHATVEVAA